MDAFEALVYGSIVPLKAPNGRNEVDMRLTIALFRALSTRTACCCSFEPLFAVRRPPSAPHAAGWEPQFFGVTCDSVGFEQKSASSYRA